VKAKGDYASGHYYIMHHQGTRVRIRRDRSAQINPQKHRSRVPIVMRDRNADQREMSTEVEEDLEWQQSGGNRFFEDLIELIKRQAKEQIKYEEEDEEDELSGKSENQVHQVMFRVDCLMSKRRYMLGIVYVCQILKT